ncbi:MAG: transposase, partial [Proteobacteria bacterium]|nr:transposase [Pseudomonadota bacterium]
MVRAIVVERQSVDAVAARFGYKTGTIYSLVRDAKAGRIELFPTVRRGPRGKRTPLEVQDEIVALRRRGLSTPDIHRQLLETETKVSTRTVERILKDAGFGKLKRRTNKELGRTVGNTIMSDRAEHLDFSELESFNIDTPTAGVFFFIPYILESGILDIVEECGLPQSSSIGSVQACLSMLLLKLVGHKRLSHIGAYDREPGLGVFAGLSSLPKPTYMSTYSCGCSEAEIMDLQNRVVSSFKRKYPGFYGSDYINLDFHSIPHYGDESEMEKIWCGARGKTMKGATTVFAQDGS